MLTIHSLWFIEPSSSSSSSWLWFRVSERFSIDHFLFIYIHHCRIFFFICSTCHVDYFLLIFHFLPFHFFFLNLAIIITTDFQPIFFYRAPVFCLCVCVCNNRSFFWIKIIIFLAPFFSVINKLATSSDIFRSIYVINFVFVKLFIIIISFFLKIVLFFFINENKINVKNFTREFCFVYFGRKLFSYNYHHISGVNIPNPNKTVSKLIY